jgi:Amidase/Histidine kinase/GAF domain
VAGVPMMNGSQLLEGYVPEIDATVVTRILEAGGTIAGKAACEDLCFSGASHTCATGPILNPHNIGHSAGGSSGGSAAVVAAGDVAMALGGDQGGSIRTPSSWCGIHGLKPTWGLVPTTGSMPISYSGRSLRPDVRVDRGRGATPASWRPSAGRSQTAEPPRDDSAPRSAPHGGPVHTTPRPSSPRPLHAAQRANCRCILAPAQPDIPAASVKEFVSGAYTFLVRSGVGWNPGVVGHARVGNDLQSPAGFAFRTGAPVVSRDLEVEPRFRTPKLLVEHGIRSAINVLIKTRGDAFGVLEVDSSHRGEFGDSDRAFLQTLANTLAIAIRAQEREDVKVHMLREKESLLRENEQLLRDKDMLVSEVHHRVTNSLQLVHSALSIQLKTLDDKGAREQVSEAAARVLAIAAVHRRLYLGGSPVGADARQYIQGLLDDMKLLLPSAGNQSLKIHMKRFLLPADDLAHWA